MKLHRTQQSPGHASHSVFLPLPPSVSAFVGVAAGANRILHRKRASGYGPERNSFLSSSSPPQQPPQQPPSWESQQEASWGRPRRKLLPPNHQRRETPKTPKMRNAKDAKRQRRETPKVRTRNAGKPKPETPKRRDAETPRHRNAKRQNAKRQNANHNDASEPLRED